MRRLALLLGVVALLVWVGSPSAHAQVAPNGWIQTQNWNMMFPLLNPDGCGGGGAAGMAENWVAPHVIGSEDPKALTVWNDIDFGGTARATGWGAEALNPDPIWVTNAALESAFGLVAGSIPNGDVVDFQGMVDYVNTNIVAGLPGPPPNLPGDNVMSLATTYVENTTGAPLAIDICSASDDSVQVWVNNTMPTNVSACRGTAGDCAERNAAILPAGISKISVLTFEGGGGWGFRLALEVDGQKATDTNGLGITFLGAGTDEVGQLQYAVDRTRGDEDPLECAGADDAAITLLGNAIGDAADALTVVETITHDQGADITVDAPGATVADILPVDDRRPVGIFDDHRIIGNADCTDVGAAVPSGSDTTEAAGVYTQSAAGNSDVWNGGDTFEYAYNRYEGDFDISIKILSKEHLESGDNWNKFGLMVRDQLVSCSRHYFQVDVLPNSRRQVQARSDANTCGASWSEEGYAQVGDPPVDVGNNPVYHRITRRAGVIQGWITEDAAVEGDAANDALWFGCNRTEGWSGDAPVYVGLATSEHSGDCGVMVMTCSVLNSTGTQVESFDPRATGKTLTYDTTRGDVDAGLSYTVATASSLNVSISGVVETAAGDPEAFVSGLGSLSLVAGNSGPVGAFDDSRDIGNPPIVGSTSEAGGEYTITGSGNDIWDGGDDFHFAYQYITGDFTATMRVLTRSTSPERWGRHGIMARYDCGRDSKFSMCETQAPTEWGVVNIPELGGAEDWPRHHFRVWHNNNGNNRDYYQVNDEILGTTIFPTDTRLPTWMRLVRQGNVFYSYMAEDADADDQPDNWCLVGSDSAMDIPDELLVGVAIHGRANQSTTITFDNWSVEALVDPEDVELEATDTAISIDYTEADGTAPAGATISQRAGAFLPQIIGERLRLTEDLVGGSATAVLYESPGDVAAESGFYIGFDAFITKPPADPVENSNPADGMTMTVIQGTKAELIGLCNIGAEPRVTDLTTAAFIGTDVGGVSTADAGLGAGPYTNVSSSSGDIWNGGDDFMFQYSEVTGDFDIACEVLSYDHNIGTGRWGKYGLMAREAIDRCGRSVQALGHGPELTEEARIAGRANWLVGEGDPPPDPCQGGFETPLAGAGAQPRFMRLTRRGNLFKVWMSNDARLADGTLDPCNDCNWAFQSADDDWGEGAPATVFVGFANSEHNSDPDATPDDPPVPATQTLQFQLLTECGGGVVPSVYAGDSGGSLGYEAGLLRERTECHPSFAVEMDNWVGGGEPGNEPSDGGQQGGTPEAPEGEWNWHTGLNVNASVSSIQTNVDFGVATGDLPDIYAPEGVHYDVFYAGTGQIDVFLNGVQVLSRKIPPLAGPFLLGFTGGTGGATCTQEIDNLVLAKVREVVGGIQKPGDENQDGAFDISDPVALLNHLFLGTNPDLPCGDGTINDAANKALLDVNGDGLIDLSDSVYGLAFLFLGGPPLVQCADLTCPCIEIEECPDNPIGGCAP